MGEDLLQKLQAIDPAVVTSVVRQDQGDPDLAVLGWSVEPLSHEKIIDTTGGLYCFSGTSTGRRGGQEWRVLLKCIHNPKDWGQQPNEWSFWQREPLAFQSGLLEQLPTGLRAPRCYGVTENENGAWVWMEYIQESTGKQWTLDHFQRAARQLGVFHGAFLNGTPVPEQPWMCEPLFRSIWEKDGFWSLIMNPLSEQNVWSSPVVQRGFPEDTKNRVLRLLAERGIFFDANDRLPQVLCHNDAHRRNLMWTLSPQSGQEELIALDWAFFGPGAVGNDLGELVGTSLYFFDYPIHEKETLSSAVLENYLAGLAENGVSIDPRLVKLGYQIGLDFFMGVQLPGWAYYMLAPENGMNVQSMYGHSPEEVLAGWVELDNYLLAQADEAREIINELEQIH